MTFDKVCCSIISFHVVPTIFAFISTKKKIKCHAIKIISIIF